MNADESLAAARALVAASGGASAMPWMIRDQFAEALAQEYVELYSIQELEDLTAFYQSRLGRSHVEKQQLIGPRMSAIIARIKGVEFGGETRLLESTVANAPQPDGGKLRARWRIRVDTRSGRAAKLLAVVGYEGKLETIDSSTPFEHEFVAGSHTVLLKLLDSKEEIVAERWSDRDGEFRDSGRAAGGQTAKFTYHAGARTSSSGSF